MESTDLAYAAGVIDSDGSIGIRRCFRTLVSGERRPYYSERVVVVQLTPQAISLIHSLLGGFRYIVKPRPSRPTDSPLYGWQIGDLKAEAALRLLLPYLRIKRAQAENCLHMRRLKIQSADQRYRKANQQWEPNNRSQNMLGGMQSVYENALRLNKNPPHD